MLETIGEFNPSFEPVHFGQPQHRPSLIVKLFVFGAEDRLECAIASHGFAVNVAGVTVKP
jgi:hypothetical protein